MNTMEHTINTFLDNGNVTDQNSLAHILDFHEEHSESLTPIASSLHYSSSEMKQNRVIVQCTILSVNYHSLNAEFFKNCVLDRYFYII